MSTTLLQGRQVVAYFYDDEIGNFHYGPSHPMKPHRIRIAHHLVQAYNLYKKMEIYRPTPMSPQQMTRFHADDYIAFLNRITPDNQNQNTLDLNKFNVDVDCPVFDGLYKYCQLYSGGSVGGAYKLNRKTADIAINWSGGLHHAKKSEASGFCYINDIVLAILELLKHHKRVLYIDIDIHHGDGVEEAFYTSDRVMTVSFHKYGEYFPGTGGVNDIGVHEGQNYSINFPLLDGIDDANFETIFKQVITKVNEHYDPEAIVLQCGADSLSGDRLGCFNLTLKGHGSCVEFVKSLNKPLLLLGGGGYTVKNVARCWAYETGLALGQKMTDELPFNNYMDWFAPDYNLHIQASNMENQNTPKYLERTQISLFEVLRALPGAPSVSHDTPIPDSIIDHHAKPEPNPDQRFTKQEQDEYISAKNEFYDS